jgi:hypothetical protein
VSRVGLRTPVPPEYMEYHEKQQRAEVDAVREARDAALSEGGLPVSAHVSEAAVHSAIRVEASASASAGLRHAPLGEVFRCGGRSATQSTDTWRLLLLCNMSICFSLHSKTQIKILVESEQKC